jgi:GNAT superfamily N-acetyltransferase
MRLRLAKEADLGVLLQLRKDAREWLRAAGTDQWSPQHATTNTPDEIERSVDARETLVVQHGGSVVATITLNRRHDDGLWYPWERGNALFAHRMIVDRSMKGHRLGAALLDVAGFCATLEGLDWLRLDCWTTNQRLHLYYEGLGFVHVRTVKDHPLPSAACYQRMATARTGPGLFTRTSVRDCWLMGRLRAG